MDQKINVEKIFEENGIFDVGKVEKINVGFTNEVYSVDDRYILKVCGAKDVASEIMMEKDVYLLRTFEGQIPVARVIAFDNSKRLIDRVYFIYEEIQGVNLYERWHSFSVSQRRDIVWQICGIMKTINSAPFEHLAGKFDFDAKLNWHDNVVNVILEFVGKIEKEGRLSAGLVEKISNYVDVNHELLYEVKMGLTYWDAHFDNFIVDEDANIVGILDFERTFITSIDYMLDIVKRMVEYPKKYASEESKKYVRTQDYAALMKWYEEFYPDLFDFNNLAARLNLYAIKSLLYDVYYYPEEEDSLILALERCLG